MSQPSLEQDLRAFSEFATHRIRRRETAESVEALVRHWRRLSEYEQTVEDIRQGIEDDARGLSEPAATVFSDIRKRLRIPG